MFKKVSINCLQIISVLIICCFILFQKSYALSPTDTTSINNINIAKKYRIEASFFGGGGQKKMDVGKTTKDEMITLSPGGGAGAKLSFGYCLNSSLNINLELGTQNSTLSKKVGNAEGSFSRTFLLGTLRYKIPITRNSSINIGGGAGQYMGGKLDIDASKIRDGGHNIFEYEKAIGIHVLGEYEHYIPKLSFLNAKWSLCIGLKYYDITYKLDSATSNGVSIPITLLPSDIKKLNGSGIDVVFSIIMHL